MRFLKTKIQRAKLAAELKQFGVNELSEYTQLLSDEVLPPISEQEYRVESLDDVPVQVHERRKRTRKSKDSTKNQCHNTKNISINYGKAIISFAVSHLAIPYLEPWLKDAKIAYPEFIAFLEKSKESIGGIKGLRSLLMTCPEDNPQMLAYKNTFKVISEVFIKYFSVSWIIHGKVVHKMTYLKYRFNMLRRIRNPENFTYIRKEKPKDSKKIGT